MNELALFSTHTFLQACLFDFGYTCSHVPTSFRHNFWFDSYLHMVVHSTTVCQLLSYLDIMDEPLDVGLANQPSANVNVKRANHKQAVTHGIHDLLLIQSQHEPVMTDAVSLLLLPLSGLEPAV